MVLTTQVPEAPPRAIARVFSAPFRWPEVAHVYMPQVGRWIDVRRFGAKITAAGVMRFRELGVTHVALEHGSKMVDFSIGELLGGGL